MCIRDSIIVTIKYAINWRVINKTQNWTIFCIIINTRRFKLLMYSFWSADKIDLLYVKKYDDAELIRYKTYKKVKYGISSCFPTRCV